MASFAFMLLFFGSLLFAIASKKQSELGPKPDDQTTRAGFAYRRERRHVDPWWWGAFGVFTLGVLVFAAIWLGWG